jgi:hypothetical protein
MYLPESFLIYIGDFGLYMRKAETFRLSPNSLHLPRLQLIYRLENEGALARNGFSRREKRAYLLAADEHLC